MKVRNTKAVIDFLEALAMQSGATLRFWLIVENVKYNNQTDGEPFDEVRTELHCSVFYRRPQRCCLSLTSAHRSRRTDVLEDSTGSDGAF